MDEDGSDDRPGDGVGSDSVVTSGRRDWDGCAGLNSVGEWSRDGDAGGRCWNVGVSEGLLARQRGWSGEDGMWASRSVRDVTGDKYQLVEDASRDERCECKG